jgi:hypothetical protein
VSGIRQSNIKDDTSASPVNHKDDISYMIDCMNFSADDIVIPYGLRMNHQPEELIIKKLGEANGGPGKIVIPYGTDLTNLEKRLSGFGEGVTPEYIIDEITGTNPYVGVDQCYNLFESYEPFSIPYEMNNKFFQYFTKLDTDDSIEAFGVLVQIYNKDFTGNLLKIDNQGNRIELGSDTYTSEGNKILYETKTILQGYTEVCNYRGFKITNKNENSYTIILPHKKDVSFMDYFGDPTISKDIVISKDLRFNDQTDNLVIQKPGQPDGGAGKIVIPYGTDLTNLGNGGRSYTPAIPDTLNTCSPSVNTYGGDSTLFQYYDTGVVVFQKDSPNLNPLFIVDKPTNQIHIVTNGANKGTINVGGERLRLFAKEKNYNIFGCTE